MPNTQTEPKGRDALLRQAYSQASKDLRQTHREEFNELHRKHAIELGVDWEPRPTAEQKAAEQIEALLAQYPQLRDRVGGQTAIDL